MKWARPRFTLRTGMIAVAILAILLGVAIEGERRRARFRRDDHRYMILSIEASLDIDPQNPKIAYYLSLYEKYHWAAKYPWFPVSADPPSPGPVRR